MKILLVDNGTKHLQSLVSLLSGHSLEIKGVGSLDDKGRWDLVVLSGGSSEAVAKNPDFFQKEISLIKSTNIPTVGICQGCELIAYSFGGVLEKQNKKAHGLRNIRVLDRKSFDLPETITVYEAHRWAIKSVGPEISILAESDMGVEILKHKFKKILGMQFHPEMFPNTSDGKRVFNSIIKNFTHQ